MKQVFAPSFTTSAFGFLGNEKAIIGFGFLGNEKTLASLDRLILISL